MGKRRYRHYDQNNNDDIDDEEDDVKYNVDAKAIEVDDEKVKNSIQLLGTSSLALTGNSGRLTWVSHSSRKSSATHSYQCVQCFRISKQWYGCQTLEFVSCAQMLLHAIAHGGCTDTVRESALEVDFGRKIPCSTGYSNPRQYCVWLFSRTLYPLSYPWPLTRLTIQSSQTTRGEEQWQSWQRWR